MDIQEISRRLRDALRAAHAYEGLFDADDDAAARAYGYLMGSVKRLADSIDADEVARHAR